MIGEGLLSIVPAGCGQLVKMLITLKSNGIFGSNLHVYLRGSFFMFVESGCISTNVKVTVP